MNTKVYYQYRDASNWKFCGEFIVSGELSRDKLTGYFFDDEYFIPDRIGLKNLIPNPRNADDHELHTLEEFEFCDEAANFCSADEFVRRFQQAYKESWFAWHISALHIELLARLNEGRVRDTRRSRLRRPT